MNGKKVALAASASIKRISLKCIHFGVFAYLYKNNIMEKLWYLK